jgi:hypothetical protein
MKSNSQSELPFSRETLAAIEGERGCVGLKVASCGWARRVIRSHLGNGKIAPLYPVFNLSR